MRNREDNEYSCVETSNVSVEIFDRAKLNNIMCFR